MTRLVQNNFARSASLLSRGAATEHTAAGRGSWRSRMSPGGAKESFAPPRLLRAGISNHGLRPWLYSVAAPRLNKDAATPRYLKSIRAFRVLCSVPASAFVTIFAMRRVLIVFLLITGGCMAPRGDNSEQSLTIYTGRDKDEVAKVVDLFTKKYPQYQGRVNTITLGAQAALDRLRAEKSNPQAGFLWGGTLQGLEQAANEGLLAPSTPTHANLIDAARKDPQGRWYAEMLLPEVIIYNHDLLKPDQAPKDWDELITPAFKEKIVIRDVMPSGTMRTIFSAMIARQLAEKGSVDAGYDWLKKLDANTVVYTPTPDDMYLKLDRGVGTVTLWNLQDALIQPLKNNR